MRVFLPVHEIGRGEMSLLKGSRVNLADLKGQMVKRIGSERLKEYFYYLTRFLSQKLSKVEYEKLCRRLLGRENLPLHNQLMRSILNNALHGKGPPLVFENGLATSILQNKNILVDAENGKEQRFMALSNQRVDSSVWSNGILPQSPRRIRSGIKDRKLKDRPSPLGPNGKVATFEETASKLTENGFLTPCDYDRPLLHLPTVTERPEEDKDGGSLRASDILQMLEKGDEARLGVLTEGADVKPGEGNHDSKSLLLAPLGIPNRFASIGGGRKSLPVNDLGNVFSCYEHGQLSDSETLRQHMNHIAASQGLAGVSEESTDILNSALDTYLKRLIRSCIELIGSRSSGHSYGDHLLKLQMPDKVKNGIVPHVHLRSSGQNIGGALEQSSSSSISLHDFRVAMELNPHQLGEDWPLLLEKVSLHPFER